MTRVAAVVPAWGAPPTLGDCLAAIRSAADPPDEIVVVEDANLRTPGGSRNAGARRTDCDVIVFVDADVVVDREAFMHIRAILDSDPGLTGVFGCYDDDPGGPLVSRFRNLLHHHVHITSAGPASTFWTGVGAIRRDEFLRLGGFDDYYAVEDIEFGMRATSAGARFRLDPRIQGKHLKRWTLGQMLWTDFMGRAIPWVVLVLRTRSGSSALNLGWRHRLSSMASLLLVGSVARRRPLTMIVALLSLLTLNRSFYALLARRCGVPGAAAGVGLHVAHHLTGVAGVPAGAAVYLRELRTARDPSGGPA